MGSYLCVTARFLVPACHSRGEGGNPEWPPSPLRLFQAMVSAAAARWNERTRLEYAVPAFRWLEQQPPPSMIAAKGVSSDTKYRLYVPDNTGDKVAKSWSGGRDADLAEYRTEKDIRPIHLEGEAVHYLYPLADGRCPHLEDLCTAARSLTHLGWGVDMVVGNAEVISEEEVAKLSGERWGPVLDSSGTALRVPVEGTLADLQSKHEAFLNRVSDDRLKPVPPLSAMRVVTYRRDIEMARRPIASFQLLTLDGEKMRPFGSTRGLHVAAMLRHLAANAAKESQWPQTEIDRFILGHGEDRSTAQHVPVGQHRFAYLPLPSIESRGVGNSRVIGSIRRVILTSFSDQYGDKLDWARRALSGWELIQESDRKPQAVISVLPNSDRMVTCYTKLSDVWSTVTPVILPGRDDRDSRKTESLLRKAICHAGFSKALADNAEIEWRQVGFWPGTDLAHRYMKPDHLSKFPAVHVQIKWRDSNRQSIQVPGPIAVGGGRFVGLGLFAAMD